VRDGLVEVALGGHRILVAGAARVGDVALVGLRPEDCVLEPAGPARLTSAQNRLEGVVRTMAPLGAVYRVVVECGIRFVAVVTRPAVDTLGLAPGARVSVSFKATAAHLVRPAR
jgi:molybdopterin-binding protein